MLIGVPTETAVGETRVAVTPETAKKLVAQGHTVQVQSGAGVAAIIERDGRYLLVEEHTPEGLRLNNPAGHLDPGESPEQGVVREALVGVYLSRFRRPASGEDVTYLRFAYAGTVGDPDPALGLDEGIVRTLWMTLDELRASRAQHRSGLVLRCIEDHAAGRRFPLDLVHADPTLVAPEIKGG